MEESIYKAYYQYLAISLIDLGGRYITYKAAKADHMQFAVDKYGGNAELLTGILEHMKEHDIETAGDAMVHMGLLESLDGDAIIEGCRRYDRWIDIRAIAKKVMAMGDATVFIDRVTEMVLEDRYDDPEDRDCWFDDMETLVTEVLNRLNPDDSPALIDELNTEPLAA